MLTSRSAPFCPPSSFAATTDEEAELAFGERLRDETSTLDAKLRASSSADYGGGYVEPRTGRPMPCFRLFLPLC